MGNEIDRLVAERIRNHLGTRVQGETVTEILDNLEDFVRERLERDDLLSEAELILAITDLATIYAHTSVHASLYVQTDRNADKEAQRLLKKVAEKVEKILEYVVKKSFTKFETASKNALRKLYELLTILKEEYTSNREQVEAELTYLISFVAERIDVLVKGMPTYVVNRTCNEQSDLSPLPSITVAKDAEAKEKLMKEIDKDLTAVMGAFMNLRNVLIFPEMETMYKYVFITSTFLASVVYLFTATFGEEARKKLCDALTSSPS